MRKSLPTLVVTLICATSAFALNNRSAVSVNGNDSNPCTVALPCRSFGVALTNTVSGGEIVALDSAGYGAFTINQSVMVSGAPGVHAAISVTSGDAIHVTAGTVTLRNLMLIGNAGGNDGVNFSGGIELHVTNCFIRGFANRGIESTQSGTVTFVDHTWIENTGVAIELDDTNGWVADSTILNCTYGARALATSGQTGAQMTLVNNRIAQITNNAVEGTGFSDLNTAVLRLDRNSLSRNGTGLSASGGSGGNVVVVLTNNDIDSIFAGGAYTINSYGNNSIDNTGGAIISSLLLK